MLAARASTSPTSRRKRRPTTMVSRGSSTIRVGCGAMAAVPLAKALRREETQRDAKSVI